MSDTVEKLKEIIARNYEYVQRLVTMSFEYDIINGDVFEVIQAFLDAAYELLTKENDSAVKLVNAVKFITFAEILHTIAVESDRKTTQRVINAVLRSMNSIKV